MLQRQIGHAGLRVSRLGLATLPWGTTVDDYDAAEHLTTFVDAGGTLLDVAADRVVTAVTGSVLASTGLRDRIVLAGSAGPHPGRGSMLDHLDATLRTLGTDRLDLWQVPTWDPTVDLDETLSALEAAVTSGRVRYVGIGNHAGWQSALVHAGLAAGRVRIASHQVEYSLLRRAVEREVVPAAEHLGFGLLAGAPLARGVLTGKYRHGLPGDSRAADPLLQPTVVEHLTSEAAGVVEAVARAADGLGVTSAQVALAWVRDRPAVASTLVGVRTTAQLKEALLAEDVTVPVEIVRALDDVSGAIA